MNSVVAVFWDYENCKHTANLSGAHLVEKLRSLVEDFGTIKSFKAYADLSLEYANAKAANFYCELQSSGVSLIHCPHNGGKDVADKMLLVDMFAFVIDNPPPATIVLITGDRDFAYAVSILKLRGYKVAVVVPPVCAHASLKAQASILFDWQKDVLAVPAGYHSRNSSTVFLASTQLSTGAQATGGLGLSVSGGFVSIAGTQLNQTKTATKPAASKPAAKPAAKKATPAKPAKAPAKKKAAPAKKTTRKAATAKKPKTIASTKTKKTSSKDTSAKKTAAKTAAAKAKAAKAQAAKVKAAKAKAAKAKAAKVKATKAVKVKATKVKGTKAAKVKAAKSKASKAKASKAKPASKLK